MKGLILGVLVVSSLASAFEPLKSAAKSKTGKTYSHAEIDALMSDASDKPACIKHEYKALVGNKAFNSKFTVRQCAFTKEKELGITVIRYNQLSDAQKAKIGDING